MAGLVPSVGLVAILNDILNKSGAVTWPLTLRLYSNNYTPVNGSTNANFTNVSGGGYAAVVLDSAEFSVTGGAPASAIYSDFIDFEFTGTTTAPGTIYGYFITDANSVVIGAERFPAESVPFDPVNGSLIRVKPQIALASS